MWGKAQEQSAPHRQHTTSGERVQASTLDKSLDKSSARLSQYLSLSLEIRNEVLIDAYAAMNSHRGSGAKTHEEWQGERPA